MIGQRLVSIILESFSSLIDSVLTDGLEGTGLSLSALFCVSSDYVMSKDSHRMFSEKKMCFVTEKLLCLLHIHARLTVTYTAA